jgi:acyl-CoA synthetase (AMP-forming)/AMP-acid ligase II
VTNRILTRLDARQARDFYAAGYWQDESLDGRFRQVAAAHPDRVAVLENSRAVTYRDLDEAADRVAAHLRVQGLSAGDRVAVWLPSRAEVAAVVLACAREGFVCCPSLHRDHTVGEVVELLRRMHASAFIGQPGYGADAGRYDIFARLGEIESVRTHLALAPAHEGGEIFPSLGRAEAGPRGGSDTDPDAVVYLAFTSGSTGLPKGVMHSSNTLLSPVRAMAEDWELGAGSVIYSLSPFSHNLGFGALLLSVCFGGTLVAHDLPRGSSVARRMAETRTSFAFGVPTHAIDLLAELDRGEVDGLPDLFGFRVSGAAVSSEVAARMLAYGVTPQSGYGMTEGGSHHYTRRDDDQALVVGSSGRPYLGHEAKIVDSDDPALELPPGSVGQILARGPSVMLGYFDDQAATETSLTEDGWLLTGDLGWADEGGYLRITGRKKDVIIRGGHNIFPARIENLTGGFPGIGRAAAIPVPDERLGERVCLVVSRVCVDDPDPQALLQHLDAAGLSKYDMPEYLQVLDAIPLLPSGKLDKRRLVDMVAAAEVTPTPIRFVPAP